MDKDFIDLAKEIQDERIKAELWQHSQDEICGETLYTLYCCWCNAFKNGKRKNSAKTFAEFLQAEKLVPTFWQKKHIAEKYFGYKFDWDNDQKIWVTKKIRNEN